MLEHSRIGPGQRAPCNLNALAEEMLTLAYQNLCASDQAFRATLRTDLDPRLGTVPLVAPDIGRTLLNLCANAFYAVRQRQQELAAAGGGPAAAYEPTVSVSTHRPTGKVVEIRVHDNGTGISREVLDIVFQPFFSTKPPGEGTGLGLSLCYDIVANGHGGTLTVASEAGRYTEFTIRLAG